MQHSSIEHLSVADSAQMSDLEDSNDEKNASDEGSNGEEDSPELPPLIVETPHDQIRCRLSSCWLVLFNCNLAFLVVVVVVSGMPLCEFVLIK